MNFIIRVELHGHGHDSPAYARLHQEMAAKGVHRTIKSADGQAYQLPSATYAYVGSYTVAAVRDWIKAIVDGLGYKSWVFVTGGESAWILPRA